MKKFLTSIAIALLLVGCAKQYDDSALKTRVDDLERRVTALETSVEALRSAIGEGVFVAKVQEYADPETGKTIGVTVTYTNGDVKYFQIHPKDNVADPVIGIIKSGSGDLVWALDGVAIKDADGKEIPVYQTPVFSIDADGFLWVEIDGKKTQLGQVQNEGATLVDGIFTDIKVEQEKVVLTLSDGTKVNIPFAEAFKLTLEAEEYAYSGTDPIVVIYDISAATTGTKVKVAGYSPFDFSVEVDAEAKAIVITPLKAKAAAQMIVVADSGIGLVSTALLLVEPEGITVVNSDSAKYLGMVDYMGDGDGDLIEAVIVSNVNFEVLSEEDWISVILVKGQAHIITLQLDSNTDTENGRAGNVYIVKEGTTLETLSPENIYQTLVIGQLPGTESDGMANLSEKESANSYMVMAPGTYKFKAVKGNTDESVGEINSVEVLWETENTETAPFEGTIIADSGIYGDYICFKATGTPGNALIAAKDASDKVLWSWHIWVPATPVENSTYGDIVSAPMMDRNLGALVPANVDAVPDGTSIGFLYQWGRKDPFPGAVSVTASDPIATTGTITLDSEKQNFTIEEAIQNPTVYVKTGGDSNKTWMTAEEMNTDFWGAEKTVYDPCPPGYIVPTRDKTNSPLWAASANFAVDETNKILKVSASAESKEVAVFPIAGYLDQGSYSKVGQRMYLWSSYASSSDKNIAYYLYVNGSSVSVTEQRMSRGGNIRCVVANENAIVPPTPPEPVIEITDLSKDGSANCYIVTEAGDYKFAAVKGNSEESVGTVAKAEILWETVNTDTAPETGSVIASVDFADGYVSFSTPETLKPGNALIAVKDADGVILWSWHIWIPATEVNIWDSEAFCGAKMMDRNLGALVATSKTGEVDILSIGLYYQWGRKDPFPGATSFAKSPKGAQVAGTEWTYHKELISTEYSIQHPTEYASVPEVDDGVWNSEDLTDLWNSEGDKKAIYDPCPPGYRVPLRDGGEPMWTKSAEGWTFEDNRFSYGDFTFTVAGYLDCWGASYAYSNLRSHIWAAKSYDTKRGGALYHRGDKDPRYYDTKFHKAKAGSVRCVAE